MRTLILSLVLALTTFSFAQGDQTIPQTFLQKLTSHCGKAYKGKIVSQPIPEDFQDKELIMYVMECSEELVKIPFFVGDDLSRTWVLSLEGGRVKLKHDHRAPDGTPEEETMYGGTATNTGLEHVQFFPADQETSLMIPAASGNMWWITISDTVYSYNLKRVDSEREFNVIFDLSKPVKNTRKPWGYK